MLIVGPNLTLDRTLRLAELRPGEVQRPASAVVTPGGKGVNVARTAGALGQPATLVGLAPGRTGALVVDLLAAEGVEVVGVAVPGEVRAAIIVIEDGGRTTVLNEPGPTLDEPGMMAYLAAAAAAVADHESVVCTGSLPPGAPDDLYARVARLAHERGRRVVVDAARAALAAVLAAAPDVVTPNLAEAEGVLDGRIDGGAEPALDEARRRATAAAVRLVGQGAGSAVVTVGRHGVAGAEPDATWWVPAHRVPVRNTAGAGDSFLAGLVVALERGSLLRAAATWGVAVAGAAVQHELAGGVDPERVAALAG